MPAEIHCEALAALLYFRGFSRVQTLTDGGSDRSELESVTGSRTAQGHIMLKIEARPGPTRVSD